MKNELMNESRTLSNYELNVLLPILKRGLETKKGKANAVTGRQIIEGLRGHGLKVSPRSLQMVINYIRTNDLVVGLVGSVAGYYITNNELEFIGYEMRLMSREAALRKVRMSITRQRRAIFSQHEERQTQLF